MIYIIVILLILFLSFQYDISGKTRYREHWYWIILAIFILIAGLRWRIGIDTTRYLYGFYHGYPTLDNFSFKTYYVGRDPFFYLINAFVKSIGGRFYLFQLIHASFVNGLIFIYIKRHSSYIFTCVFFYAIMTYLNYNAEIMRGSMSIVICLFANDYFLEKKWLKGYLLLVIALMFHGQTIVLFFMPLFLFLRFNFIGIVTLVAAFVVGQFAGSLLNNYVELLMFDKIEDKALSYAELEKLGGEQGLRWIFGHVFSQFVYIFAALWYIKHRKPNMQLLLLEPFIMFYCVFLMVNIGFKITYRFVEYYSIYASMLYAYVFVKVAKDRALKKGLSYVRALVVIFPLFWLFQSRHIVPPNELYRRYFPYSSVIEKSIDKKREDIYNRSSFPVNYNEY